MTDHTFGFYVAYEKIVLIATCLAFEIHIQQISNYLRLSEKPNFRIFQLYYLNLTGRGIVI